MATEHRKTQQKLRKKHIAKKFSNLVHTLGPTLTTLYREFRGWHNYEQFQLVNLKMTLLKIWHTNTTTQ